LPRLPLAAEPPPEAATEADEEAVEPEPAEGEDATLDPELAMVPEYPDEVGAEVW
jgi:hypothetical protein